MAIFKVSRILPIMRVYCGKAILQIGSQEVECRLRVSFVLNREHPLLLHVSKPPNELAQASLNGDQIKVLIADVEPFSCCVTVDLTSSGLKNCVLTPLVSLVRRTSKNRFDCTRVEVSLVNMPMLDFAVREDDPLVFGDPKWIFEVRPSLAAGSKNSFEEFGRPYFINQRIILRRRDGGSFTSIEAQTEINLLHEFLSLVFGKWIGTSHLAAYSKDGLLCYEEWGLSRTSTNKVSPGWFDLHHPKSLALLYPGFSHRFRLPEWNKALHICLYWNTRADTYLIGPDSSIILLQAALERLSHTYIYKNGTRPPKGKKPQSALDKLRWLLNGLHIPVAIPESLRCLSAFAQRRNWLDGPQVLIEIRNNLTHPRGEDSGKAPYSEAYLLAKWYFELCILALCGYKGQYWNRSKISGCIGQVEAMPWSKKG